MSTVAVGGCCGAQDDHRGQEHTALLAVLDERHPAHAGRGTNAVHRARADALVALAVQAPHLSAALLPHVREELEFGRDPLLVAAAGRVVAVLSGAGPGRHEPGPLPPELLLSALNNVRETDDIVRLLDGAGTGTNHPTTAAGELLDALTAVGVPAHVRKALSALAAEPFAVPRAARPALDRALAAPPPAAAPDQRLDPPREEPPPDEPALRMKMLARTRFQDQDGRDLSATELFCGLPAVVVFFYTRCDNPLKCSLTISTLARLQQARDTGGGPAFRTLAVTYDPAWDVPARLYAYGANRGMRFSAHDRLLRATAAADEFDAYLVPGVGHGPVTVNRHRAELYVLDGDARVSAVRFRTRWTPDEALALVRAAASG